MWQLLWNWACFAISLAIVIVVLASLVVVVAFSIAIVLSVFVVVAFVCCLATRLHLALFHRFWGN